MREHDLLDDIQAETEAIGTACLALRSAEGVEQLRQQVSGDAAGICHRDHHCFSRRPIDFDMHRGVLFTVLERVAQQV